jgi:iron complex outermembrane receptor protein
MAAAHGALQFSGGENQMLQRNRLSLAVSAAVGALGLSGAAYAQTPATTTAATTQKLDRVEVTGSLIKRIESEVALPVTTITIEEAQKQGVTNAEQSLRLITQNNAGGAATSGSVSANNGGASYASLRALGAQRTLVLLNGKRIINNPNGTVAVDLNTLPSAAVERIEVLSDGASSTYGTDAIAGVINYITRKTYQGITVGAEAQIPWLGGGEIYLGNVLAGWGNLATQGWNIFGSVNYRKQQPLQGNERDFMQTSYIPSKGFDGTSPTTFPANYTQTGTINTATNPTIPTCFPPSSIRVGNNSFCSADTQLWTQVIPEQQQTSAFLRGSLALGQSNTLSLEYFWSQNVVTSQIAPSPEAGLTMRNNNPYYPGRGITPITNTALNPANPISVGWRTTVLGPRQTEITNDTQRAVLSLDGSAGTWDYAANLLWSTAKVESQFLQGYGNRQALVNGMTGANGAPFLNPFGNQTDAGLAYLQANQVLGQIQDITGTLWSINGVASTSFGNLAGGPMQLALGAEYRSEDNTFKTDVAKASQSSSSGLAGSAPLREGDRNVWAVALEMNFPILKNLDVGFAIRYDDYSDFGGTTNPKIAVKYQPVQQLLLRGSYNTGFAAPTLAQLYAPNATTFTGGRYNDPVLCPGGVPNTAAGAVQSRDCGIQFQQLQGGNTQLQPEKSDAWTVGFVLQPTANFSFGIDYWNYVVTDNLGTLGETTIFGDPTKYSSLFVRCSAAPPSRTGTIPGCQIPGGDPLAYIVNTQQNLGDTKTSGVDLQLNFNTKPESWGALTLGIRGTYILNYEFQVEPNGQWYNPVGNFNAQFGGPVLRYQQITTLGWTMGPWSALLSNRYQSGYFDQNPAGSVAAGYRQNTVGNYSVWNLVGTWAGYKGLTLQAGILNLFNADPPYSNQTLRFQARAYDDRFASPLGRTWQLGARYEFK